MPALNPHSPVPLYFQLAKIILDKVRRGEFAPGTRLPSEHSLAAAYHIGRPTARQATEQLVRKGILVRRRGAGTFVQAQPREVDLFSFGGTIASFREKGISITTRLRQKTRLKTISLGGLNPFSGRPAYFLSRLSCADGRPVLIEDIYLDADLFANFQRFDAGRESLSRIAAEHYYLRPVGGKQHFGICFLKGKMASDLGVAPDMPILSVKRFINFEHAGNAVYAELFCRTDTYIFSQRFGGVDNEKPGLL